VKKKKCVKTEDNYLLSTKVFVYLQPKTTGIMATDQSIIQENEKRYLRFNGLSILFNLQT
jgi:hypothetical protein